MDASAGARIANIGPRERRKRLRFGVVAFGVSVAIGALLVASGVPPVWRLVLFPPLFVAGLGYFQARDVYIKALVTAGASRRSRW